MTNVDPVVPGAPAAPVLSAHDAAMIAKVDAMTAATHLAVTGRPAPAAPVLPAVPGAPAAAAVVRPADVPEKFWDASKGVVNTAALLKSYADMERMRGTPVVAPAAPVAAPVVNAAVQVATAASDAAKAAAAAAPTDAALAAAAVSAEAARVAAVAAVPAVPAAAPAEAFSMDKFSQEYAETGALSADSFAALEKQGLPKAMVETYIAGQVALAEARTNEGITLAGGKDAYTAMASWAAANLAAADLDTFNASVSGSPAQMKQAVLALKAQYEAANGAAPTLAKGGGGGADGGSGAFASRAEVTAAMRDPRYKADHAYRSEVERRIGLMEVF